MYTRTMSVGYEGPGKQKRGTQADAPESQDERHTGDPLDEGVAKRDTRMA